MYKNQMRERFNPGTDLTAIATEPVVGKTFVNYSGPMVKGNIAVKPAVAGTAIAGVAKYDQAANELVGVARGAARVVTVTTATTLAAGDPVEVGANGQATKQASGIIVGWAVDAAEAGSDALISLAH